MKKNLLLLIMIFVVVVLYGCNSTNKKQQVYTQGSSNYIQNTINTTLPSWSKELILTYDGNLYDVTNEKTQNINKKIGEIAYHGRIAAGFEIYSIKNVDDYSKIAVNTKEGYLIAVRDKKGK